MHEDSSNNLGFIQSLAADPDYNLATMNKALSVLKNKLLTTEEVANKFGTLLQEVSDRERR